MTVADCQTGCMLGNIFFGHFGKDEVGLAVIYKLHFHLVWMKLPLASV